MSDNTHRYDACPDPEWCRAHQNCHGCGDDCDGHHVPAVGSSEWSRQMGE